jgi:hypothetical protein
VKILMAIVSAFICHSADDLARREELAKIDKIQHTVSRVLFEMDARDLKHCKIIRETTRVTAIEGDGEIIRIKYFDPDIKKHHESGYGVEWEGYGIASEFGTELPSYPVKPPSKKLLELRKRIDELQKKRGLR